MTKLLPALLLLTTSLAVPAMAQTKLTPKPATTARADSCAPIGRTAKGDLVYSMKCENIPAPPPSAAPPPEAEAKPVPPPEPETQRSGLFGLSFDRRQEQ